MPKFKKIILLVEDDLLITRMYQRKLEQNEFSVVLAANGEEGLDAIKKQRPDLILLDVMMPKMNGVEMLKILKGDDDLKSIPVIILTNLSDRSDDVKGCKALGARDYWVKANVSLKEITEKIKKILSKKNRR